ncbi:MAG: ABC transporter ATP-binding protein [Geminicoccaceae bacterium]
MPATPGSKSALRSEGLVVSFPESGGKLTFRALDLAALTCEPGRLHVVTGPSGSGKSTLLHVLSGIATADEGTIRWGDLELSALPEAHRDAWRRRHVGFVFQTFHLIQELDATDNVLLPVWFGQWRAGAMATRAEQLLSTLAVPAGRGPVGRLSRGEQQRVALARALIFDPPIMLADEPTASLDARTGEIVTSMLHSMARDEGRTVIAVSHDPALIERADVLIEMDRGQLITEASQLGETAA